MATRAGHARAGVSTRSMLKLGIGTTFSCDREFGLRDSHFNGPFSCYCRRCHLNGPLSCHMHCRSCGHLFVRLAALQLQGYVLATLIIATTGKMATTAHEDQGDYKTDDHAGDGADDDTHRPARLGCQCTGQLTGQHKRDWLRWRW